MNDGIDLGIVADGAGLRYMTNAERALCLAGRKPVQLVVIVKPIPHPTEVQDEYRSVDDGRERAGER